MLWTDEDNFIRYVFFKSYYSHFWGNKKPRATRQKPCQETQKLVGGSS